MTLVKICIKHGKSVTVSLFIAKQQTTMSERLANFSISWWAPFSSTRSSWVTFPLYDTGYKQLLVNKSLYFDILIHISLVNIVPVLPSIPSDLLELWETEGQLLLVASIFTPKGRRRFAKWIPICPYPMMNTYTQECGVILHIKRIQLQQTEAGKIC